jgi:hypothetical protein
MNQQDHRGSGDFVLCCCTLITQSPRPSVPRGLVAFLKLHGIATFADPPPAEARSAEAICPRHDPDRDPRQPRFG